MSVSLHCSLNNYESEPKKKAAHHFGRTLPHLAVFPFIRCFSNPMTLRGKIPVGQAVKSPAVLDLKDIYLKRNPKKSGGRKETSFQDIDPTIHLELLESFDPGSPLNARNMFSQESAPSERIPSTGNLRNKRPAGSATPERLDTFRNEQSRSGVWASTNGAISRH